MRCSGSKAHESFPRRLPRAQITGRQSKVSWATFGPSQEPAMMQASDATAIPKERLEAHAAWLARGRSGEGRLVVRDEALSGSLQGADLRFAELEHCVLSGVELVRARLDGARLRRCTLERADLRHASLAEAGFEDCDLRRAMIAGATLAKTAFLRCAFGDFGSQTIGKPDVKAPYVVLVPDVSHQGDGSRIGTPAEIDARWFSMPGDALTRRFTFDSNDGSRYIALVLHMHVQWAREVGPRFQDRVASQTLRQFLADGAPMPWRDSLPRTVETKLRETVGALVDAWTPDSASIH